MLHSYFIRFDTSYYYKKIFETGEVIYYKEWDEEIKIDHEEKRIKIDAPITRLVD